MSVRAKQSWPRRVVFAGAVLATTALAIGVMPRSATAQYAYYYGYGYPAPAYSYSPYAYPGYSYYPNPAYNYYPHHWHGDGDERHGWDQGWSGRGWDHRGWHNAGRGKHDDDD